MSPLPAYKDILGALSALLDTGRGSLTEFEIARFRRDAESLKKASDPDVQAHGYAVLGVLARVEGDIEALHANHGKALLLSGNSPIELHNYACSLLGRALFAQGLVYSMQAVDRDPDNVTMLSTLIAALYANQRIDELVAAFARFKTLTGESHGLEQKLVEDGTMDAYHRLLADIEQELVSPEDARMWKEMLLDTELSLSLMLTPAAVDSLAEA